MIFNRSITQIVSSDFCTLVFFSYTKFKSINGWLKENSLTGLLRWRREKKKEEVRLLTAKIHAALSVAQLAAAIAGFAATNSMEKENNTTNEAVKMSNGVAYASALLASACAEAAESVGARRSHVASAVNSGLATQAPSDIITLTAAAATSNVCHMLFVLIIFDFERNKS